MDESTYSTNFGDTRIVLEKRDLSRKLQWEFFALLMRRYILYLPKD